MGKQIPLGLGDTTTASGQAIKLQNVFEFALYYHNEGGFDDGVFNPDTEPLICAMMDLLRNHPNNISSDFLQEKLGEYFQALEEKHYIDFVKNNSEGISDMLLRENKLS